MHKKVKLLEIFVIWECLNVGTVLTYKMHNIGAVPIFRMHNIRTVPMFKMHNVGTLKIIFVLSWHLDGIKGNSRKTSWG